MATLARAASVQPVPPRRSFRAGLLTAVLLLPASLWYLVLLVAPLAIVVVMSFGTPSRIGGFDPVFSLDNYSQAFERSTPFVTSLVMAVAGTALCLFTALPLAYFIATRAGRRKSLLIVLLIVPFWTSFLIRTYAWLTILGPDGLGDSSATSSAIRPSGSWARPRPCFSAWSTATCRSWSSRST
ncbi:MAG: hypothetical protein WKF78_04910 [Candidatus Limnocylindrales bacterium]